jgi:hypothetical protein
MKANQIFAPQSIDKHIGSTLYLKEGAKCPKRFKEKPKTSLGPIVSIVVEHLKPE